MTLNSTGYTRQRPIAHLPQLVWCLILRLEETLREDFGCVANFAQEVVTGQLPLSVEGLSGQGVEQFGRSAALVSLLDHQLSFLDHVHEFDAGERGLSRVKRFEP